MKRVVVTGASGALGVCFVRHLRSLNAYDVYTLNRSTPAEDTQNVECDLSQPGHVTRALDGVKPDYIVHLAATFSSDFSESYQVNFWAGKEILEWVEAVRPVCRVLLVGTAAEYGVVTPAENPISEKRALAPVSVYGLTKAFQTQLVAFYAARGVGAVCARIFNLRGDGFSERLFVGKVNAQIDAIKRGSQTHLVVGPLSACRDYVHTDEAVGQMMVILRHGIAGETYHVASGRPITMRSMLEEELAINGLDFSVVREANQFSDRRGYDVPVIYADMSKTHQLLEKAMSDG